MNGGAARCARKLLWRLGKLNFNAVFTPPALDCRPGNQFFGAAMDLIFLLLAIGLYVLTLGLGLLCARLLEKKS